MRLACLWLSARLWSRLHGPRLQIVAFLSRKASCIAQLAILARLLFSQIHTKSVPAILRVALRRQTITMAVRQSVHIRIQAFFDAFTGGIVILLCLLLLSASPGAVREVNGVLVSD